MKKEELIEKAGITEEEMQELIRDALINCAGENAMRIETFEENGLLTNDKGLVITIGDGDYQIEYQVTIVRSR